MDEAARLNRLRERWTWSFGSALASQMRIAAVIETHFADIYNEVRFYLSDPRGSMTPTVVSYNRPGRLHILGPSNPGSTKPLDVVPDAGSAMSVTRAVDWVLRNAGPSIAPADPQIAVSLRLMAKLLSQTVASDVGVPWKWKNGYLDAASFVGRRRAFFDAVPEASRACPPDRDDPHGMRARDFWFLVGDADRPQLGLEIPTGRIFPSG